jgi:membrane-associated protease RseP (regulator of RpoE activity)
VGSLAGNEVESEETKQGRIEFSFPMLTVRTRMFSRIFDRLGSLRASRLLSWVALVIVPVVAGIGLYLVCTSLFTLLWTPLARDVTRELGPLAYLLLPGINPIFPLLYGWLAIICAIVVHECAHGIIARNRGLNVKSSGLLFFLIIPIGAFVDVDEDQIAKAKPKDSLRVMAAGVAGNVVVAIACILVVLVIVNGLTPVIDGVYISDVIEGMPAEAAGLLPEDVFVSVDNTEIANYETLKALFENKTPGDTVQVTVARGENWAGRFSTSITLTESEGRAVMGVTLGDFMGLTLGDLMTEERLTLYRTLNPGTLSIYMVPPSLAPGLVPFSDSLIPFYTHSLGSQWHVYANIFFWLWFVNVNVAVFNALPIIPMDGGRMFNISLKSILGRRASEKTISRITYAVTAALVCVLLMIYVIPFIM